jgi:predicted nucleic acid-binding protein
VELFLDTNVLNDACDPESPGHAWAKRLLIDSVPAGRVVTNVVVVAELCVGDEQPDRVADRVRGFGVEVLDLPAAVAPIAAKAFAAYRKRRVAAGTQAGTATPLPDFFIGAHALILGLPLATGDTRRFAKCFPKLRIIKPPPVRSP